MRCEIALVGRGRTTSGILDEAGRAAAEFGMKSRYFKLTPRFGEISGSGVQVIITGSDVSAEAAARLAAKTGIPVISIPKSTAQLKKTQGVVCVAIGGGFNAGLLAAQFVGATDSSRGAEIFGKIGLYKNNLRREVARMKLP